ncbi:uncharacterized protein A1O5_01589 [Cladophialophora psammophila CBS 110553]|uniref:Uncharacterized protein n=1 Tax=Cladophialophora psammophila CBS 110553 TaxID=1182543 RepID=W9X3Z1_9EURO|nr:uncharacterized protein A1O5_01589 [Cladophialophora psammophila CBS 110553]EXJ74893.1 hypothetical protein A1O5_01589 [Cladophialophora psammophila CBS 110553]
MVTHRGLATLQELSKLIVKQNRLLLDDRTGFYQGLEYLAKILAIMLSEDRRTEQFWRKIALIKQQSGFVSELTDDEITTRDSSEAENNIRVKQAHPVESDTQTVEKRSKQPCPSPNSENHTKELYRRGDLKLWSRRMEDYIIQDNWVFITTLEYQNPRLEPSTISKLQEWVSSPVSAFLWISKDFAINYPSPLSIVSANLVEMAVEMHLSVCAFFCSWPADYPGGSKEEKEYACVRDFLYSLLRQVIDLLPPQFEVEGACDITSERLLALDDLGSKKAWATGLDLLKSLLPCVPQPTLIVLDGIEHLDQTSVANLAAEVLCVLGDAIFKKASDYNSSEGSSSMSKHPMKVFFTTAGDCDTLSALQENMEESRFERVIERHDLKRRQRRSF